MKRKKLLRKIKELLSADQRAQVAKYDSLEKVLGQLAAKEVTFRERLDAEDDKERRREILRKIEVIDAQRRKGEKLKEEIRELRDTE